MRVSPNVQADPKAPSTDVASSGIFTSYSISSHTGEFEIGCGASTRDIRPLFNEVKAQREACFAILGQLGEGLDLLHSRGIVHGFLRTETLLVDGRGQVFVPDWFLRWESAPLDQLATHLPHISPEFLREERLTPATDQFLLACIAYRLLYGVFPFEASSRVEQLLRITCGIWAEAPPLERDIGICDVWDRAFSIQPEWRFPSCRSFIDGLRAAFSSSFATGSNAEQTFASSTEEPVTHRSGSGLIWAAAGLLAIGSVGLGAWSANLSKQLRSQTEQLESGSDTGTVDSAPLQNGILSVCNSAALPLQILDVSAIYRKDNSLQVFNSTDHQTAKWIVAPASRKSLSFIENANISWDGSALFYYLVYQSDENYFVSTGLWDKGNGCLELGQK
jgi:serine/threonine protein kinase